MYFRFIIFIIIDLMRVYYVSGSGNIWRVYRLLKGDIELNKKINNIVLSVIVGWK